ncbi:MAG: glutathione peroxidase [Bacilli bacterium]|nr:glutathione peroxidase [Bacilli bacterium]MDY6392193.1 glutathione peroxidase [Bacilli bacterium]
MASIYDYSVKDMEGKDISLSDYKGKVLLIVNTATGCGFTPQYEGLEALYGKYKDQGFEILDFPCNQFFGQAPGSDEQIHSFCTLKYNVSFKQFHKIDVNGKNEDPLYTFLKEQKKGRIKWNFTKFLVDRDGNVVDRFGPAEKPAKFESKIAELL